jgi:hypothetical protein
MPPISGRASGTVTAGGMLRGRTPVEDHRTAYGLWVKREDLSCPPPGPPFSKARGVYARVASRPEGVIAVLDTRHSQAGWAVARACQVLGKECVNFYPEFKHSPGPREPQLRAKSLGAELVGLKAGMSAVLWNVANRRCREEGWYLMPNALKLSESVAETAKEVPLRVYEWVLIPVSSGTIAAGVISGFCRRILKRPRFILHLGYSRSHDELRAYVAAASGVDLPSGSVVLADEKYHYKDTSRPGPTPPWPCNEYYDLKAFRWWLANRGRFPGETLFWNVG